MKYKLKAAPYDIKRALRTNRIKIEGVRFKRVPEPPRDEPWVKRIRSNATWTLCRFFTVPINFLSVGVFRNNFAISCENIDVSIYELVRIVISFRMQGLRNTIIHSFN